MPGEIVPFGKYRGQPIETLAADQDYAQWLLSQPWFRDRWPNVYNIVVNYGGEPQDSPEHNQMQARFLDNEWCFALADVLFPRIAGSYREAGGIKLVEADPQYQRYKSYVSEIAVEGGPYAHTQFEVRGWDVVFSVEPVCLSVGLESLPSCICDCGDHSECPDCAACKGGDAVYACRHSHCPDKREANYQGSEHCGETCPWAGRVSSPGNPRGRTNRAWLLDNDMERWYQDEETWNRKIRVELKPDLGDDFPAVMRQVQGYERDGSRDRRVVVARRHAFEQVTWEQVGKMFAASGIALVAEAAIEEARRAAGEPGGPDPPG